MSSRRIHLEARTGRLRIRAVPTESLGNHSYLIAARHGGIVVDPPRDGWRLVDLARSHATDIRYVVETHVHNDYLTGALEIRALTGATIVAPADGRYRFAHRSVRDGDTVRLDGLTLEAVATPGHTPEHTSFLVYADERLAPTAVLTGGSLLDGTVGRTDLLGRERLEGLTRAQFASLQRLTALPDDTLVLPTHGAGSFCTSGTSRQSRITTLGEQRRHNPALRTTDVERFVRDRLGEVRPRPAYYSQMAPVNRVGPPLLGAPPATVPPLLTAAEVARATADGAWIVDARDRRAFAADHLPGAINVELDRDFATYVGCVVPAGSRLVLVLPQPVAASATESLCQLLRIGYDRIVGRVAYPFVGRAVCSYPVMTATDHARSRGHERIIDVREPAERARCSIPGSSGVFVGELPGAIAELGRIRDRIWTICASGRRAAIAASLLDRAGLSTGLIGSGGVDDWLTAVDRATHAALQREPTYDNEGPSP